MNLEKIFLWIFKLFAFHFGRVKSFDIFYDQFFLLLIFNTYIKTIGKKYLDTAFLNIDFLLEKFSWLSKKLKLMSLFVHSSGGGGQNWLKFGPRSCWMTPYPQNIGAKITVWPEPIWIKVKKSGILLPQHQSTYPSGPESVSIEIPPFRPKFT